jgi:hypothetical protein
MQQCYPYWPQRVTFNRTWAAHLAKKVKYMHNPHIDNTKRKDLENFVPEGQRHSR